MYFAKGLTYDISHRRKPDHFSRSNAFPRATIDILHPSMQTYRQSTRTDKNGNGLASLTKALCDPL